MYFETVPRPVPVVETTDIVHTQIIMGEWWRPFSGHEMKHSEGAVVSSSVILHHSKVRPVRLSISHELVMHLGPRQHSSLLSEKPSGSGHLSLFCSRQSMGLLTLLKLDFRPQWMAWTLPWPTIFPELLLLPLSWHLLQLPNFSGLALK